MKPLGSPSSSIEQVAERVLKDVSSLESATIQYEPSVGSVVSPIHRGVESACFNVNAGDQELFLKIRYPDMAAFFNEKSVFEGAQRASELGVGPRLINAQTATGSYLFERLDNRWSWGKVNNFEDNIVLENTVTFKKAIHCSDALLSNQSVFDQIKSYVRIIEQENIVVPKAIGLVQEKVGKIAEAINSAGVDLVPCHGDGVASNVMISKAGAVKLVDFDSAGNQDPYFDLGSLIVEIAQFPNLARAVLEIYNGECRETEFNRCMLYGIADDLKWAMWGFISSVRSQRSHVEFVKYAEWRLLRSHSNASGRDYDRWLNKL
ncbi:MAG: phosphotransferase [Hyphomicrobiales bacterium]